MLSISKEKTKTTVSKLLYLLLFLSGCAEADIEGEEIIMSELFDTKPTCIHWRISWWLGNCYLSIENIDAAIMWSNKSLESTENEHTLSLMADVYYLGLNDYDTALKYYQRAIALNPFDELLYEGALLTARRVDRTTYSILLDEFKNNIYENSLNSLRVHIVLLLLDRKTRRANRFVEENYQQILSSKAFKSLKELILLVESNTLEISSVDYFLDIDEYVGSIALEVYESSR